MEKYEYLRKISFDEIKEKLPERFPESHKGTFGKLLCICGSKNMPGAAYFCVESAVRCGVGLVKTVIPDSIYTATSKKISETVFFIAKEDNEGFISDDSLDDILKEAENCTAILVGCGMGWNSNTRNIVYELIRNSNVPIVIDADGINVVSENIDVLKECKSSIVITPHLKEMSRLINRDVEFISVNKANCAKDFSTKYGVVTVLKGNRTVISDEEGNLHINETGNAGMAKGGSGDVLAGMIGSFLAQKMSAIDAALCGVFIHGMSGDKAKNKKSMIAMTPTDIINELPDVFLKFEQG